MSDLILRVLGPVGDSTSKVDGRLTDNRSLMQAGGSRERLVLRDGIDLAAVCR